MIKALLIVLICAVSCLGSGCRESRPADHHPRLPTPTNGLKTVRKAQLPNPKVVELWRKVDRTRLMSTVKRLVAPELKGRRAYSPESRTVALWLAGEFKRFELKAAYPGFLQKFAARFGTNRQDQNVVGFRPACGGKMIIVGAHYDHLGMRGKSQHYPGADDNATGIAALLESARLLSRNRTRNGIYWVAFGSEESGQLEGSGAFVKAPPFGLKNMLLMVNLDMLGRAFLEKFLGKTVPHGLGLVTHKTPKTALAFLQRKAPALKLKLMPVSEGMMRIFGANYNYDSQAFNKLGLPTLFLSTSMHDDWHTPNDTIDKIRPDKLRRVTALLVSLLQYLAGPPCPTR